MSIVIGCDHRGFLLKEHIKSVMGSEKDFIDVGCYSEESVDYPIISKKLVLKQKEIAEQNNDKEISNTFGIIICGSGIGVSIAVNKFPFIRGALVFNEAIAKSARQHNNSNVLCLPADHLTKDKAIEIIKIFVSENFEGGRHEKRVKELSKISC